MLSLLHLLNKSPVCCGLWSNCLTAVALELELSACSYFEARALWVIKALYNAVTCSGIPTFCFRSSEVHSVPDENLHVFTQRVFGFMDVQDHSWRADSYCIHCFYAFYCRFQRCQYFVPVRPISRLHHRNISLNITHSRLGTPDDLFGWGSTFNFHVFLFPSFVFTYFVHCILLYFMT